MKTSGKRDTAVAGQFYPADERDLRDTVRRYLDDSEVEPQPDLVQAIVSPHAGYIYSGFTAAHAFQRVRGKDPNRAILLGCSHHFPIETASVYTEGAFRTPLGDLPIDEAFARELAQALASESPAAHLPEHALEVQLPFLAEAVGIVPIVPVLFGGPAGDRHAEMGRAIGRMLDTGDLVVASTDLSHYLTEAQANVIDRHSIDTVLEKNCTAFADDVQAGHSSMCGASAVVAAMACSLERDARHWQLLDYRTSAWASGDTTRVVGYAAMSMERAA